MRYPKQTIPCTACKGQKRVAIIKSGPKLFQDVIGRPLELTYAEARYRLRNYKGKDAGALTMLVRELANNLDSMPCPWCDATGISYTLQQLTPEEKAREES